MKPIHLKKGKLLDAHEGFVETFNWLVDSIQNLCGDGERIEVKRPSENVPMICYNAPGDDGGGGNDTPDPIDPPDPLDYSALLALIELLSGGGGGEVTVQDADGNSVTGSTIQFETGSDSSVSFGISKDDDGVIHVKVDTYYA